MGPSQSKVDTNKADMDNEEQMLEEICAKIQQGNLRMKAIMNNKGNDVIVGQLQLLNMMQDPALKISLELSKNVNSLPPEHQKIVGQIIADFKALLIKTIKFCGDIEAHHSQEKSAIEKLKLIHEMAKANSDEDNAMLIGAARKNFDEAYSMSQTLVGRSQQLIEEYGNLKKQIDDEAEELKKLSQNKKFWRNIAAGCAAVGGLIVVGAGAAALTVATFGATAPLVALGTTMLVCGSVSGVVASLGAAAALSVASALKGTEDMVSVFAEQMKALSKGAEQAESQLQEIHRLLRRDEVKGKEMVDALSPDMHNKHIVAILSQKSKYDHLLLMEQNLEEILLVARELSDTTAQSCKILMRRK